MVGACIHPEMVPTAGVTTAAQPVPSPPPPVSSLRRTIPRATSVTASIVSRGCFFAPVYPAVSLAIFPRCLRGWRCRQLVVMPYAALLSRETREAMGVRLEGAVVVVDEAHNIVEAINSVHSKRVVLSEVCRCVSANVFLFGFLG